MSKDFKAGDWFHNASGQQLWIESIRPSGHYVVLPLKPGQQSFAPLLEMRRITPEMLASCIELYGLTPGKFEPVSVTGGESE